jgi:endonuclease YncB( thermonuclease family)
MLTLLFLLLCSACGRDSGRLSGKVTRVLSGDVLVLKAAPEGRPVRVRLAGIDCPERGQPYRTEAKTLTSQLAFGKTVTVRAAGRNSLGYLVGTVTLPNGRVLNRELVAAGLAWQKGWLFFDDAELKVLEQRARRARKGLWKDPSPTPPWKFLRNKSWRG